MIQLSNVRKSYQIGKETFDVLHSIDLDIHQGEYVSIMGPSGSGKSTIMNIIGCLDRPTSGTYQLTAKTFLHIKIKNWRQSVTGPSVLYFSNFSFFRG